MIEFRRSDEQARWEAWEDDALIAWIDDVDLGMNPRLLEIWKCYIKAGPEQQKTIDQYLFAFGTGRAA